MWQSKCWLYFQSNERARQSDIIFCAKDGCNRVLQAPSGLLVDSPVKGGPDTWQKKNIQHQSVPLAPCQLWVSCRSLLMTVFSLKNLSWSSWSKLEVPLKTGVPPNHPCLIGIFYLKPTILGYPHSGKPLYNDKRWRNGYGLGSHRLPGWAAPSDLPGPVRSQSRWLGPGAGGRTISCESESVHSVQEWLYHIHMV